MPVRGFRSDVLVFGALDPDGIVLIATPRFLLDRLGFTVTAAPDASGG